MTKRLKITVGGIEVFNRTYADDEYSTITIETEEVDSEE